MFGYDWARLHAALNDFPAALLLAAVLFDLLGAALRRESLKAAGFWCLLSGVAGGAVAAFAGVMAEGRIEHSEQAHAVMETHETLAFIVLGLFALLALWRIVRRGVLGQREQAVFSTAGVIGVALLVFAAKLGGDLVFSHASGISNQTLRAVTEERAATHEHEPGVQAAPPAPAPDSAPATAAESTDHPH